MNRYLLPLIGAVWLGLSFSTSAHAISVQYGLTSLGGNAYRYEYSIANDGSLGAGVPVELFDIYFDPTLYLESSLNIVSSGPAAVNWNQIILSSGPSIPAAFDALALNGGIANGAVATGFAVDFTWLGLGTPGAQLFDIYSPTTFSLLGSGTTQPVPIPGTLPLIGLGGAIAMLFMRRRPRASASAASNA